MMAHRFLLAGRLRVHVHDDRIRHLPERAGIELPVDRQEGIVERVHVEAAHDVDDEDALAGRRIDEVRAAPGRPCGVIDRSQKPRLALDEHEGLALVPGVIAERDRIGAGIQEIVADRLGDAEAAGRVLAVDDHAIEPPSLPQAGQTVDDRVAAWPSDHIAEKEKTHGRSLNGARKWV